ncbi:hypothetical protein G6O67_000653 [Ophiocordyceps sinensis]|uniref:SAM-dependent MTase RsmB/NOP-type domain-containing protein n=1 Tax=Ophiocordyceps sinensis TaxID=72228 RepID=A0A8H4V9V8_9HYPO|nr:hypothetical protein G6O67_000653 [Ophiocordyceps sinensis]
MGRKNFMGKNRRGAGAGGRGGGQPGGGWRDRGVMVKENEGLQNYYDTLLQLPDEEKQQYWDALKRELPNSFRFCGSKGHALAVKRLLQTRYIPEIVKIEFEDGKPVEPPMPVPWYPDELAWWMTTPKHVVRKFPPFAAFQKFLVSETSVGNISRQEVVSMIPPLLMDLRPGMTVLDMCAAPGSKSAQLLEMIHRGEEARVRKVLRSFAKEDGLDLGKETQDEIDAHLEADPSDNGRATGLLIANDSDFKRGHMLVHQLKRLSSPNLIVTCHDATQFPSLKLPPLDPASSKPVYLKFDRILADVPCSGDGTLRKNANLWRDWQPGNALGLHVVQVRILVRALQLLKKGGRVVYSTCSMNPVENESVVASAIERCGGPANVEIVDCSNQLPGLQRRPGLKSWKIMDKSARIWDTWEQVEQFAKEENDGVIPARVVQTMFPRLEGSDCSDLPLDRCTRVYAHLQDTGGFFIAVLEKMSDFKVRNENEPTKASASSGASTQTAAPDTAEDETPKAEPTPAAVAPETTKYETPKAEQASTPAPVAETTEIEPNDVDEHQVSIKLEASPNGTKRALDGIEDGDQQTAKKVKTEAAGTDTPIVMIQAQPGAVNKPKKNPPVEEPFKYLDSSHPVIQNIQKFYSISSRFPDNRYMVRNGRGVRFVHGGVRMFMKQDAPSAEVCGWRIQAEGMPILQGYVGEPRVIHLRNKETLRKLLIEMFPRISHEAWKNFDEIGEQVRDVGMGCCVLRVEPDGEDPDFSERMALPLWKSIHSLNLMLPKEDRSAMLLRVYNDTTPLVNISLQKQKPKAQHADDAGPQTKAEELEKPKDEVDSDMEDLPTPESTDGGVKDSENKEPKLEASDS